MSNYNDNANIENNFTDPDGDINDIRPGGDGSGVIGADGETYEVYGGDSGTEEVSQEAIDYMRTLPCGKFNIKAFRTLFFRLFKLADESYIQEGGVNLLLDGTHMNGDLAAGIYAADDVTFTVTNPSTVKSAYVSFDIEIEQGVIHLGDNTGTQGFIAAEALIDGNNVGRSYNQANTISSVNQRASGYIDEAAVAGVGFTLAPSASQNVILSGRQQVFGTMRNLLPSPGPAISLRWKIQTL